MTRVGYSVKHCPVLMWHKWWEEDEKRKEDEQKKMLVKFRCMICGLYDTIAVLKEHKCHEE